MSVVEEVGARIVLHNQRAAITGMDAFKKSIVSAGATVKKTNAEMIAANQKVIDSTAKVSASRADLGAAQQRLAAKMMAANTEMDASAKVTADEAEAAARRQVAALRTVALAASNEKASAVANARVVSMSGAAASDASVASAGKASAAWNKMAGVGKVAFLGMAAGAGVLALQGVKSALSFTSAMELVHTQAGIAQNRIAGLSSALVKMSPSVLQGPTELANQLYRIASSTSGMKETNAQLLGMTRAAAMLAAIGGPGTDPVAAARVLGGITASGVKGAGTPQNIVALANATVGTGDMKMQDFMDFIGTGVLSSAKLSGVTLPQVSAFAAMMGDNLMNGSVSGHSLSHALMLMAAPNTAATKALGSVGMDPSRMGVMMQTQGLPAALKYLSDSLKGPMGKGANLDQLAKYEPTWTKAQLTQAQTHGLGSMGAVGQQAIEEVLTRAFGGAKQAIPIITAIQQQPRYNTKITDAQQQMGDFADTWKQTMNTPANVFKRWDLDLKQFETNLGLYLIPKLITVGNWAKDHKPLMIGLGVAAGGVMTLGFLAWAGSLSAAALAFLGLDVAAAPALGIMALVAIAVGGITIGIYELWKHWDQIWKWMGDHKQYAAIILIAALVIAPFLAIPIILAGIATHWSTFWTDLKQYAATGVNDIIDIINDFTTGVNGSLGWAGVHIPQIGHVTWGMQAGPQQAQQSANAASMGGAARAPGAFAGSGGGISGNNSKMMATGGMITNTPTAIVGEGNPAHPEWVIPTDPAYRKRALGLYASLGTQLMSKGGSIVGKLESAAKDTFDPFGLLGKAGHEIGGAALGPLESAALGAANGLPAGWIRQTADGVIKKLFTWALGQGKSSGGSGGTGGGGGGSAAPAGQIKAWIDQALGLMGQPLSFEGGLYKLIMAESGGSPGAVNRTDSNWLAGHPSKGLTQTIDSTFGAYVLPSLRGAGIFDPIANITAGFRYAMANYGAGMIEAGGRHTASGGYLGYAKGGVLPVASYDVGGLLPVGASIAVNGTGKPEPVGHGLGTTVNVNIAGSVYGDRKALMKEITQAVSYAVARS